MPTSARADVGIGPYMGNQNRKNRVSPLQRLSAGPAGIQVVPRILFALKSMDFGAFSFFVLKIKTQTEGEINNGKRITQGV